ncbi:membrane protein insertase YidC, partial [Candidatus Liberibacter asiaticus]
MERNWNYFVAIALSVIIVYAWQNFYVYPRIEEMNNERKNIQTVKQPNQVDNSYAAVLIDDRAQALSMSPRVELKNPSLIGSINLKGAQFDDLNLRGYHLDVSSNSPIVTLLSPSNTKNAYFAELDYVSTANNIELPNSNTVWNLISGKILTPTTPIKLVFKNANNILFERTISLDEHYLFKIVDTVTNNSIDQIRFSPRGRIMRHKPQTATNTFGVQEGFIAVLG